MMLGPDGLAGELSQRLAVIQAWLDELSRQIAEHPPELPRITPIESEYNRR